MVSFDVESLFTNIPLDDCTNLAVKYITEGNPGLKLSKNELKRLFEFATKETHFLFNVNFYDQVDSVAMGSPLPLFSPISLWVTMRIYGWINMGIQRYYSIVATYTIHFAFSTLNGMHSFSSITSTINTPIYALQ